MIFFFFAEMLLLGISCLPAERMAGIGEGRRTHVHQSKEKWGGGEGRVPRTKFYSHNLAHRKQSLIQSQKHWKKSPKQITEKNK